MIRQILKLTTYRVYAMCHKASKIQLIIALIWTIKMIIINLQKIASIIKINKIKQI